jgi:type II secretory pathway component PulC
MHPTHVAAENLRAGGPPGQVEGMRRIALVSLLAVASCGGEASTLPAPAQPMSVKMPAKQAAAAAQAAEHSLARSAVHQAVVMGLGAFLQRVELDDHPVLAAGKFHGFRIATLVDPSFWQGVDIRPGDVVTSVNGFPIERPEQAQTAFESLEVASELRVAYDRDGQSRELVYAIVDDR